MDTNTFFISRMSTMPALDTASAGTEIGASEGLSSFNEIRIGFPIGWAHVKKLTDKYVQLLYQ